MTIIIVMYMLRWKAVIEKIMFYLLKQETWHKKLKQYLSTVKQRYNMNNGKGVGGLLPSQYNW